ncbi:hypothetical protein MCOR18_004280 [Pyricularia oryzae]|uniref:Uncharacterized protein n=3 Tax=Pyricularia TaxID=48558 RepID=A0ABQ8NLI3_PYRGI|nr:hypothetical protein MCOR33_005070 [Pyricularia grisea]KAI6346463.1 hypothetical protein MCOR30_000577 [Pyricularia oryzae]KAI6483532.1 hypothetical protein MCOR18_004280 [Pyricularia oryzae]KAI6510563.1 hypothetical protein MCOR13_001011 [Pyricularia oryzae]
MSRPVRDLTTCWIYLCRIVTKYATEELMFDDIGRLPGEVHSFLKDVLRPLRAMLVGRLPPCSQTSLLVYASKNRAHATGNPYLRDRFLLAGMITMGQDPITSSPAYKTKNLSNQFNFLSNEANTIPSPGSDGRSHELALFREILCEHPLPVAAEYLAASELRSWVDSDRMVRDGKLVHFHVNYRIFTFSTTSPVESFQLNRAISKADASRVKNDDEWRQLPREINDAVRCYDERYPSLPVNGRTSGLYKPGKSLL